ncbi:MAG TPA: amidase family protein [Candidatus Acidoferrum sp.]|jgi:Asp-tRNA(Asn)/Glu-tRNA(Gln) amidotransferase A subunit family amidase
MVDRRSFLTACSALGLSGTLFPGVLWAQAQAQGAAKITKEMIDNAAKLADVAIPDEDKQMMLDDLNQRAGGYEQIHALHMENSVDPALIFDPILPGTKYETAKRPLRMSVAKLPEAFADFGKAGGRTDFEALAFASVRELAELVRTRRVSSVNLTTMYLQRLKRYDPTLKFVITLTEERALNQAKEADREIAAGKYRGPLHGLPWGAKDLLAAKGYPTTWGAGGFEKQVIDEDAEVVRRLDRAGAVLVAKLTLGALAQGDVWFGGKTRNPWNPAQGSSGSSAGPASATAAGCVAFSIGSETLGSISSPSTRCGTTGLRPTFGLVPRTGAMALSWSMDKLGPICRTVEDCALVLSAIHGPDGKDRTVRDAAFNWDGQLDWRKLRVGYLKSDFERRAPGAAATAAAEEPAASIEEQKKRDEQRRRRELGMARAEYDRKFNDAALAKLKEMGVQMTPVEMPKFPYGPMVAMLTAEAAAAFDDLTRSGRDKLLTAQGPQDWPNAFRSARFIPAVEYIQAARARRMAMEAVAKVFADFDVIVAPTGSQQLTITNLTGQPAVILPNGFRGDDAPKPFSTEDGSDDNVAGPGTPVSLTFLGNLYGEAKLLAFARAYQEASGFHLRHPKLG